MRLKSGRWGVLVPAILVVTLATATPGLTESIDEGDQVIDGTEVHTTIYYDRGYATFSNSCGTQRLTQGELQGGAKPDDIIPCPQEDSTESAPQSDAARERCNDLIGQYNDSLQTPVPPEFGRYLQNQLRVVMGSGVVEPAKACADAEVYRKIRRDTMSIKLAAARQCSGVTALHDDKGAPMTPELVEAQIRDEEADIAKTTARICAAAQAQLGRSPSTATTPAPTQAPRTAMAPAPKEPPQPKQSAAKPAPGEPTDLDVAMGFCVRLYPQMGVAINSADDAVKWCADKYPAVFGSATPAQIDAAFARAQRENAPAQPAPAQKPQPAACVQLGKSTRIPCSGDAAGENNCKCQRFNNLCGVPVTAHYKITAKPGSGASNSAGGVALDPAGKGQSSDSACTSNSAETLTYTGWEQRAH